MSRALFTCVVLICSSLASAQERKPILGDYDSAIRTPEGRIDVQANVRALKQLGANTYFYLVWHSKHDWDDLPDFAEAAAREHIDVWVYIVPWSETPLVKRTIGFSEPFRTDYVRWAEEIAKISLAHKNVVGYVIDDFFVNLGPDKFNVPYVRKMTKAGKAINPNLKFYPLCYFGQAWKDFVDEFGPLVDGVVAAYPKSRLQVGNALAYLNDEAHGASAMVQFPRRTPSRPDDKGSVTGEFRLLEGARDATLSFYWDDDNRTEQRGYHEAFVKVNDRIVWQADTAGDTEDHVVEIPLERHARRGGRVRIEIGVMETRGVGHYPIRVKFDDIRISGADTPGEMTGEKHWTPKLVGPFEVDVTPGSRGQTGRFSIPMIVMPAGEAAQHRKRYPEDGRPAEVAAKVRIGVEMMLAGRVEGVVTYCLPKGKANPIFDAVAEEYRHGWKGIRAKRGAGTR
ncbi:MAG TPA: hypothetical protein VK986_26965 [Tepidisphaeraceae bacterium]|nr:hypothetical protein [Tepidisphaeraceae bacterium]